jgi:hypothetical protein
MIYINEVMDPAMLSERNRQIQMAMDLIQHARQYALDHPTITNHGHQLGNGWGGNAKVLAKLPLPVALFLAREAPATIIDDKMWHSFLEANPGYKVGQR